MYACLHADEIGNEVQENADLLTVQRSFHYMKWRILRAVKKKCKRGRACNSC